MPVFSCWRQAQASMREGFLARYEGDAQLLVRLQSLEVCTFEPLLLQVPADWPTNEPLHVPVHQVPSQLKTTALPFLSLEESKYLHSRLAHHRYVAGQTATPLKPMTSMSLRYHVRHEYEYFDVCVNRSDDNMLDVCFQESQLTSDPATTPQQCNKRDRQRCQSS